MISSAIVFSALELGFIYALVALALFLSYRTLNIADMTTDGAFTLGCAVSATFAVAGHPLLGIPAAMLAGACAGGVTAFLQTKLNIPSILAGIITNTGLYTVNLAVMGFSSNVNMMRADTLFSLLQPVLGKTFGKIIPVALIALLTAVSLVKASGLTDLLTSLCAPLLSAVGFPAECIPLALIRPISGSGSLAVYESLLDSYGPDSTVGTIASVLQGSSETTFYTIALYYGTCGIRNGRHTLLCALCGDCTAFLCSCLCIRVFG